MRIRDLARELGISTGTVSRALNNREDVSAETRARVLQEAARLGYKPSHIARSLSQGTTNTVALMVKSMVDVSGFDETFFMTIADGLQLSLAEKNLDLILLVCGSNQDHEAFLQRAVERRVADAYIISDTRPIDRRIDYLIERQIPFVAFGRSVSGGTHSWVDLDFEGAADQTVERLLALGHRRIALAKVAREIYGTIVFTEALYHALEKSGLVEDPHLTFHVENTERGGYELGERILSIEKPPTAVILLRETLAIGLYRKLFEMGKEPGRDLSIIGFRENINTRFLTPPLTCFRVNPRELGRKLGETMLAILKPVPSPNGSSPIQHLWPMTLQPGGSDGELLGAAPRIIA